MNDHKRKVPKNPWGSMNHVMRSTVSVDGFNLSVSNWKVARSQYAEKVALLTDDNGYHNEDFDVTHFNLAYSIDVMLIMACTVVEGWCNILGLELLGSHYKKTIERLGIIQKINTLMAIRSGVVLPDANDTLKDLRKMFDRRNSLVHPKAVKLTNDNLEQYAVRHDDTGDEIVVFITETLSKAYALFDAYGLVSPIQKSPCNLQSVESVIPPD